MVLPPSFCPLSDIYEVATHAGGDTVIKAKVFFVFLSANGLPESVTIALLLKNNSFFLWAVPRVRRKQLLYVVFIVTMGFLETVTRRYVDPTPTNLSTETNTHSDANIISSVFSLVWRMKLRLTNERSRTRANGR